MTNVLQEKMNKLRQVKDVVFTNKITDKCVFNLKEIEQLIKENPNDYDLGAKVREFYLKSLEK